MLDSEVIRQDFTHVEIRIAIYTAAKQYFYLNCKRQYKCFYSKVNRTSVNNKVYNFNRKCPDFGITKLNSAYHLFQ